MHALDARAMRQQYAKDIGLISSKVFVCTIDYAQNINLPHVSSTPSAWYFMSLINVSLFGVYSENSKRQTNFVYSERKAGKGSNEVISMLHAFAINQGIYTNGRGEACWTIYADNCGGQNKNSHLLRYLMFLVDSGRIRAANLHFLIKGHTKNNCDRGFAMVKKAYAKSDIYTIAQVDEMIKRSSSANESRCIEDDDGLFIDWNSTLSPLYRDVKNIQRYQLFSISSSSPGVVSCRKRPTDNFDMQRISKAELVDWAEVWASFKPLPKPGCNPEKVADLHRKILPYIPEKYRTDSLYRAPTEEELVEAQARKKRRVKRAPTHAERH
ncbi:hypothetical protein P43SY_011158 [Pythium insidiosum]|uniref:DUF7869 domain-containing protein n=1 Tax=Pythium insidiosum TaxID=114742 RepID=A0AAD5Q0S6_PYTIN|nr:hypothetical protein P43SY_011158 [Pythium insidiosum]